MVERARVRDGMSAEVIHPKDNLRLLENATWKCIFDTEHWRDGKMIAHSVSENLLTTEGKRYMVDICMKGNVGNTYTFHTAWFVCLAGNGPGGGAPTTAPTPATSMTYVTKGFTEFEDYDESVRQTWIGTLDGSAASITSNTAKATFTVSAESSNTGKIFGAGLVTLDTKGDSTTGDYLLNYSNFTTTLDVADNDIVKVGVTIQLS